MSCSYYTWKGDSWTGSYFCCKKNDYVNSDVYTRYCRGYSYDECPIYKGSGSSGGCYLTSACIYAKGLSDDCYELETLRKFRDGWLKEQENGDSFIKKYYEIAPRIVSNINDSNHKQMIYQNLYDNLIVPCVEYIENGKNTEALKLYKETTERLESQFGGEDEEK